MLLDRLRNKETVPLATPSTALGLSPNQLQDVVTCALLSEAVYKAAEGPPAAALAALHSLRTQFPAGLAPLLSVQFCRRSAEHRYMLAATSSALYCAFMGTKQPRDYWTDANLRWAEAELDAAGVAGGSADDAATAGQAPPPAVHRGFLRRSQAIPVEQLFDHAQKQGLRLVLCGHSLGGAVAQLCTLRLLRLLHSTLPPQQSLSCIVFGCPAIGNAALAESVRRWGWDDFLLSIALPEDVVPRLLLQAQAPGGSAQAAATEEALEAAAAGEQEAPVPPNDSVSSSSSSSGSGINSNSNLVPSASQLAVWRAAAAAAVQAARVGAGRLMPPSLLPTFAHIGSQHLLLDHGLVTAAKAAAEAAASVAETSPTSRPLQGLGEPVMPMPLPQQAQQARQVQQLLLGLHSMQHYRFRLAAACWAAVGHGAGRQAGKDGDIALSRDLAPAMVVQRAAAQLPVLPPVPPIGRPPAQQRSRIAGRWAAVAAPLQRPARPAQQRQQRLVVVVTGCGLEGCTGALLRMPGTSEGWLVASQVTNLARQQLLDQLAGGSSVGQSIGLSGRGALRKAVAKLGSWGRGQDHQQQATSDGLLLHFAVPALSIARLRLQEHQQGAEQLVLPEGMLALLSDFSRTEAQVHLQPQVVWMIGLEPSLAAIFQHLRSAAAREGAAQPATAAATGAVATQARGPAEEQQSSGNLLAGSKQEPTLPATLLRGQLLLDITPAILTASNGVSGGADAVQQQLAVAREVVRWAAKRLQKGATASQHGEQHADAAAGEREQGIEEEVEQAEDEDLAELAQLSLAARIRRSVAQAGAAARRRALLLRTLRGPSLSSFLPVPDVVVLVMGHRQLLSGRYGEGLDGTVLAAVRQLVSACRECGGGRGAPLLLALSSRRPLSSPYRHQIARSCGLADDGSSGGGSGKWGSVVPLLEEATEDGAAAAAVARFGLLEAALHAYGARRQRDSAERQGSKL